MKSKHFFLGASIPFALSYWLLDSMVHYFGYGEIKFEFIPSDLNEMWMRCIIVILLVVFGIFADYHMNKIIKKDIEKHDVYISMLNATKHILNNFLQSMKLIQSVAEGSGNIDKKILNLYDQTIDSTIKQIKNLEDIKEPSKEAIEKRFLPK